MLTPSPLEHRFRFPLNGPALPLCTPPLVPSTPYHRLLALTRDGDARAAEDLETEARRRQDTSSLALALTAQEPSAARWKQLCEILTHLDDIHPLEAPLSTWPNALKIAPLPWIESAFLDQPPPALALTRVLRISYHHNLTPRGLARLLNAVRTPAELECIACGIHDEHAERIATHPAARTLVNLNLFDNGVGDAGARALAASPHLGGLKWLNLIDNFVDEIGAVALFAALRSCRVVLSPSDWSDVLPLESMTRSGWVELCKRVDDHVPPVTSEIESINLVMHRWNPTFRVAPPPWTRALLLGHPHPRMRLVRTLRIDAREHPGLESPRLDILSQDPHLLYLKRFFLQHHSLGPEGASRLARASFLPQLESLAVQFAHIQDRGLTAILPHTGLHLHTLALAGNALSPQSADLIAEHTPHLRHLYLFDNHLTDYSAQRLAVALPELQTLSLKNNRIGNRGLRALLKHSRLRTVDLRDNPGIDAPTEPLPRGWLLSR